VQFRNAVLMITVQMTSTSDYHRQYVSIATRRVIRICPTIYSFDNLLCPS